MWHRRDSCRVLRVSRRCRFRRFVSAREVAVITRRDALKRTAQFGAAAVLPLNLSKISADEPSGVEVNDVQSQLNRTHVSRIVKPRSLDDIQAALRLAQSENRSVSVAGGRHSMGGQQFGSDT